MKFLKKVFAAYLIFLFVAGHAVVGIAAFYAYERIGKSPRKILAIGGEHLKALSPSLGALVVSYATVSSPQTLAKISLPSLEKWRGPGASPQRSSWRPAYDAKGKPLSMVDIARGVRPHVRPINFPQRIISVDSVKALKKAIRAAVPGDAITIKPGNYIFLGRSIYVKNPGRADAPIAIRAEKLGTVTLQFDLLEGFLVTAPFWIFENLHIEGVCPSDSKCEHAFHVTGKGRSLVIRNNRVYDFNAQLKVNAGSVYIKNNKRQRDWPDFGLVEGNSWADRRVRDTGNPVTKLNINGVSEWVVRDNLIADFEKGKSNQISYAAFMKANGRNGVFENNAVICHMNTKDQGGIRLGLSFGGGGTGKRFCRNYNCDTEHTNGVIRNNIILNCPKDVGIYLNRSKGTQIVNNGIYNTAGVDVRFSTSSAYFSNNIIEGRIKERNGGKAMVENNLILGGGMFGGKNISDIFADAVNADFGLIDKTETIGRGVAIKGLGLDFCGNRRKEIAPDLGPLDNLGPSTCDVRDIWRKK